MQSRWGWAFSVEGRPWVAQRVWPRPSVDSPCSRFPRAPFPGCRGCRPRAPARCRRRWSAPRAPRSHSRGIPAFSGPGRADPCTGAGRYRRLCRTWIQNFPGLRFLAGQGRSRCRYSATPRLCSTTATILSQTLVAKLRRGRFDHDADDGLGARGPHQDAAGIAQPGRFIVDFLPRSRRLLRGPACSHTRTLTSFWGSRVITRASSDSGRPGSCHHLQQQQRGRQPVPGGARFRG